MKYLMIALGIEVLKLKRTLVLALVLVAPAVVGLLEFAQILERARLGTSMIDDDWTNLTQNALLLWNLMVLPLFITLQSALLAGLEHTSKGWKRMFSAPVPRAAEYAAKQIVALGVIGLSTAALVALTVVIGLALGAIWPQLPLTAEAIPWRLMLTAAARSYLACWLLIALHTWIAGRWPSFAVAATIGVVATVAGIMVFNSRYGPYYPWTIPWLVGHAVYEEGGMQVAFLMGLLGAPVVALLGCWDVTHRDALCML